jgi:hypothetical protein
VFLSLVKEKAEMLENSPPQASPSRSRKYNEG